jgi:hypothetical protein
MAEPTDRELDAEVAAILRRPPDDPERLALEAQIEQCEAIMLYAWHLAPKDEMECKPRDCEECGESFTPPRDAGALYCSMACLRKCIRREAMRDIKFDRQSNAAERESQPT